MQAHSMLPLETSLIAWTFSWIFYVISTSLKILGDGGITRKSELRVHAMSEGARVKIESTGGTVEIIKE